jgi:phenylacetate-coenzyme A ligase PaaK-like adenylate-forming protein
MSISEKILRFIQTVDMAAFDDDIFNQFALELFRYQFARNAIYRGVCQQQKALPLRVKHWREIPAVTTSAFKEAPLVCFPAHEAAAIFHTSGTTQKRSGKHYFRTLDFYRAAMLRSFAAYGLDDKNFKMRMFFLGPTFELFPNSSLGYMFSGLRDEFGDEKSAAFFSPQHIEARGLQSALDEAAEKNTPVFILGTALALLECMEVFQQQNRKFQLPFGSRILDTGGYKNRRVEITREEFRQRLCEAFGVPREYLLNEYGMTELSSQFYESHLPQLVWHSVSAMSLAPSPRHFMPPWVRVVAVDPENLNVLPEGEMGLLRIFDLANVDSVMAIQTEDIGRAWQNRLELIGRATGAALRGCSLLTETIAHVA